MDLLKKKCVPCEGGVLPFSRDEAEKYLEQVPRWTLVPDPNPEPSRYGGRFGAWLSREFKFKDFIGAINFVNRVAEIAEEEGHHPDIQIHYNKILLELWTHTIGGLSENDFILAAKIDANNIF